VEKKKKERKPYSARAAVPVKETTDADWGTIYKPATESRRVGSKNASAKKSGKAKSPEPTKDS